MSERWIELTVVAVALVIYLVLRRMDRTSPSEIRRLVDDGALLLDVRTPEEFAGGHIDGALNIPVDDLDARIGELEDKARPVVVYCRSGMRSSRAKQVLEGKGFAEVHNLGAMSRWG